MQTMPTIVYQVATPELAAIVGDIITKMMAMDLRGKQVDLTSPKAVRAALNPRTYGEQIVERFADRAAVMAQEPGPTLNMV